MVLRLRVASYLSLVLKVFSLGLVVTALCLSREGGVQFTAWGLVHVAVGVVSLLVQSNAFDVLIWFTNGLLSGLVSGVNPNVFLGSFVTWVVAKAIDFAYPYLQHYLEDLRLGSCGYEDYWSGVFSSRDWRWWWIVVVPLAIATPHVALGLTMPLPKWCVRVLVTDNVFLVLYALVDLYHVGRKRVPNFHAQVLPTVVFRVGWGIDVWTWCWLLMSQKHPPSVVGTMIGASMVGYCIWDLQMWHLLSYEVQRYGEPEYNHIRQWRKSLF